MSDFTQMRRMKPSELASEHSFKLSHNEAAHAQTGNNGNVAAQMKIQQSLNQSPKAQSLAQIQRMMQPSVQRQEGGEEDELLQSKAIQREMEDEEPLQSMAVQQHMTDEEEPLQSMALQRQAEDEEPLQSMAVQRQMSEEEDPMQSKAIQRRYDDDEEVQQAKSIQRQSVEDEEPLQSKTVQRLASVDEEPLQGKSSTENKTGLPDNLKSGVENLSGTSLDDVRVHYNSSAPPTVQALAYTQGTDIHVAPGQEQHLPHEAWHAAQQKQGRVQPTVQARGVAINDDSSLEKEADTMGAKALQQPAQRQENSSPFRSR